MLRLHRRTAPLSILRRAHRTPHRREVQGKGGGEPHYAEQEVHDRTREEVLTNKKRNNKEIKKKITTHQILI